MRALIVVVAFAALTGCKSAGEHAAEADGYCRSLGAQPGSDAYVNCRLAIRQEQEGKRRAALTAIGDGLGQASDNIARNQTIANANRPLNCTSQTNFGITNTTCQ